MAEPGCVARFVDREPSMRAAGRPAPLDRSCLVTVGCVNAGSQFDEL